MKLGIDITYMHHANILKFSGIGLFTCQVVNELTKMNKYDIFVYTRPEVSEAAKQYLDKCHIITLDYSTKMAYLKEVFLQNRALIEHVRQDNMDVLLSTKFNTYGGIPDDIPYIAVLHDLDFLCQNSIRNRIRDKWMKSKVEKIDCIITISNFVKEELYRWAPHAKGKTKVIYNPVIIDKGKEDDSKNTYILNVNTFKKEKNQITLLKAYNKIANEIVEDLVLVGTGDCLEKCKNYVKDKNLNKRVFFYQDLSQSKLNDLMTNARIFVNTSRFEGFGRTPIEAAMHGVPVLTSRETSLGEVTQDLLEYYDPADNVDKLAEKIKLILKGIINYDQERIDRISAIYNRNYAALKIAKAYDELITQVYDARKK